MQKIERWSQELDNITVYNTKSLSQANIYAGKMSFRKILNRNIGQVINKSI